MILKKQMFVVYIYIIDKSIFESMKEKIINIWTDFNLSPNYW